MHVSMYLRTTRRKNKDGSVDVLYKHAEEVERTVFFHTANRFNLQTDLIFYDTATASFTTDYQVDNPDVCLRQFGHSKEGTWTAQAVVTLAVTREARCAAGCCRAARPM